MPIGEGRGVEEKQDYKGPERRSAPRLKERLNIDFALETHVDNAGKVRLTSTWTNNIGELGVCLVTEESYAIGASILLMIRIPGEEQPVPAIAKVIWWKHARNNPEFRIGCEFVEIAKADKEKLLHYLKTRL